MTIEAGEWFCIEGIEPLSTIGLTEREQSVSSVASKRLRGVFAQKDLLSGR